MIGGAPERVLHRPASDLSPEDRRDLATYCAFLRAHFGVADNQPLFPASAPTRRPSLLPTRSSAKNRPGHPWRASVARTGGLS